MNDADITAVALEFWVQAEVLGAAAAAAAAAVQTAASIGGEGCSPQYE